MSRPENVDPLVDIRSDDRFMALHRQADFATMTSIERQHALYEAVLYIHRNRIPGDIMECGVWHGGSMLIVAALLAQLGDLERTLWLADTFLGMTEPGPEDVNFEGVPGSRLYESGYLKADRNTVRDVMDLSLYPRDKIVLLKGDIRQTAPIWAQQKVPLALLRLDTDFEDSTRVELEHLYPLLVSGGVLIVDDYFHWHGCKKAVDEYFKWSGPMMHRLDYSARLWIKP